MYTKNIIILYIKTNSDASNFELSEMKYKSLQYHIAALNSIKNLMGALKTLENPNEISTAMICNDELTDILNEGEKHFKSYVIKSNFSKESLELYVLFLRNSMV